MPEIKWHLKSEKKEKKIVAQQRHNTVEKRGKNRRNDWRGDKYPSNFVESYPFCSKELYDIENKTQNIPL